MNSTRPTDKSASQRTKDLPIAQRSLYVHGRVRRVLWALRHADHDLAVKDIAAITGIVDPMISEYLRMARRDNLVEMVGQSPEDRRLHLYRITTEGDAFLREEHGEPQTDPKGEETP